MALKTFNLNEEVYKEFSDLSKKHGFSMSKKIENFIREELDNIKGNNTKKTNSINQEIKKETGNDYHPMGRYC